MPSSETTKKSPKAIIICNTFITKPNRFILRTTCSKLQLDLENNL